MPFEGSWRAGASREESWEEGNGKKNGRRVQRRAVRGGLSPQVAVRSPAQPALLSQALSSADFCRSQRCFMWREISILEHGHYFSFCLWLNEWRDGHPRPLVWRSEGAVDALGWAGTGWLEAVLHGPGPETILAAAVTPLQLGESSVARAAPSMRCTCKQATSARFR